jgi:hypothetical protein
MLLASESSHSHALCYEYKIHLCVPVTLRLSASLSYERPLDAPSIKLSARSASGPEGKVAAILRASAIWGKGCVSKRA